MKKISLLFAFIAFSLTSCSSDEPGPRGEPGSDRLGYTFEETVNLEYESEGNFYSAFILIGDEISTIEPEADAVLVYRLEPVEGNNGDIIDSWSLLPQNFFIEDQGIIQYVYRHTVGDVEIFLEGNFDMSELDANYFNDQTFRVVVIPSDFVNQMNVDFSDLDAVMQALEL